MMSSTTSGSADPSTAHRLVIVEGIMGSGKSTTMRLIAKHLQEAGQPALPVHERTLRTALRTTVMD
ncbi:hypothetical protein E5S69_12315 [Cupriavidus necator]|nr:hypothetical protein [Cupriavidus necator]